MCMVYGVVLRPYTYISCKPRRGRFPTYITCNRWPKRAGIVPPKITWYQSHPLLGSSCPNPKTKTSCLSSAAAALLPPPRLIAAPQPKPCRRCTSVPPPPTTCTKTQNPKKQELRRRRTSLCRRRHKTTQPKPTRRRHDLVRRRCTFIRSDGANIDNLQRCNARCRPWLSSLAAADA
jgi:hypothetical protein